VLASYSVIREADSDGLGVVLLRDASLVGETLREQEELAVQLSHELRAPLTTILGYAQLISNPNATSLQPDAQTEFARRISESGDYMLRLVNNLLDLGRVSRDEAEAPPLQPVDVVGLSRDTVEAVRQQANQKGQELRFDSALDSLVVQSSDLALRQILNNLLANAIKYTPPSGQVWRPRSGRSSGR
jgi:signal transduction histidine kinase